MSQTVSTRRVPKIDVFLIGSSYGHVTMDPDPNAQDRRTWVESRCRVWVTVPSLDELDLARPQLTVARNAPSTGQLEYIPLTDDQRSVRRFECGRMMWRIETPAFRLVLIPAPCVCGAGAVGGASVVPVRHSLVPVRTDVAAVREWFTAMP